MNLNRIIANGFSGSKTKTIKPKPSTKNHCKVYLPRTKPTNDEFDYNPLNVCIV